MIENIPLPRLLNSSGGTERRIHPQRVSINLAITPLSDATMSLSQDESLPARSYVELYTCMGSAGIFRVRSPQDAYGTVSTTAELEHAIVEVGDYLVKAKYDEMMAADTAIQTIFGYYGGSKWQLGDITAIGTGQVAVQVNYDRVLDAILAILEQKPDCMLAFDFSTPTWTVSIVSRGTTVTAEGRLARNVNYARVTYDDTELCTRAYYEKEAETSGAVSSFPVFDVTQNYSKNYYVNYNNELYKLPDGHVKGVTWATTTKTKMTDIPTTVWAYVDSDTIGTYGIIEREVKTGSKYTADEALRVANEYIRKHKYPRVSVEISAAELSHITGEPLDSFDIGKLYRLALADYGVTVDKTVTNLYFADVYGLPDTITVSLAEEEDTALNFIHDLDAKGGSGGGGGGGGGAKKEQDDIFKEFRTQFEMDDYHLRLQAQRVSITEHVLQQAGMYINHEGVLIYAQDNEKMIGSKIQAEADRISLVVDGYGEDAVINPASIVLAINGGSSEIKLDADHIDIGGVIDVINNDGGATLVISADSIDIDGVVSELETYDIQCDSITCTSESSFDGGIGTTDISGSGAYFDEGSIGDFDCTDLTVNGNAATWKTASIKHITSVSNGHYFLYGSSSSSQSPSGSVNGYLVTGTTTTTINYLGK